MASNAGEDGDGDVWRRWPVAEATEVGGEVVGNAIIKSAFSGLIISPILMDHGFLYVFKLEN